jgi:hypothetical protein
MCLPVSVAVGSLRRFQPQIGRLASAVLPAHVAEGMER